MKRILLVLFLIVTFCSCNISDSINENTMSTTDPAVEITKPSISTVTPVPLHSELYISGLSVDDVIVYFNEVCLDAEFVNGGDPQKIQKWNSPMYYYVYGEPTQADLDQLRDFCGWLNGLYGFPGIYEINSPADANLKIYFCDYDTMIHVLGDHFHGMDGGVTFWYDCDVIYNETICIRTDLNQELRNSVILEEIYNGLGPIQDTVLRPDSVIFSDFTQPQELSQIDELLLKLMYHPDIKCGMDAAACEVVIRQLYY